MTVLMCRTEKKKMSKRQSEALEESILKWEKILDGTGFDMASNNCPLCQVNKRCSSCIIYQHTNEPECFKTPFEEWYEHQRDIHTRFMFSERRIECKRCREYAKAELEFLKSLRDDNG